MTTNNATETTTVINNFINIDETKLREQIAQEIEAQIKDNEWAGAYTVAAAIARGQK